MYKQWRDCICSLLLVLFMLHRKAMNFTQGYIAASSHKELPRASRQNPQARENNNKSLSVILHVLEFNIMQSFFPLSLDHS